MTNPVLSVVLLENINLTAVKAFEAVGIQVRHLTTALDESSLVGLIRDLPPGQVMLGIRSKTKLSAEFFGQVPQLIAVGTFCIGTDQVDLAAATKRGIAVFNAPFSNTRSVAELVMAEIVMLARQVFRRSVACHEGRWLKDSDGAHEVRGKTLGIVGYGNIGSQLSELAEAFGMKVIYYDIEPKLPRGRAKPVRQLERLLAMSDFVSLHVSCTDDRKNIGMIGFEQFSQMKSGICLINASRGKVVQIDALKRALDSGIVSGAAIDVFPEEPNGNGQGFHCILRGDQRVILTPHIGGSTEEAQAAIGTEVSETLANYYTTGSTLGSVNLPHVSGDLFDRASVQRLLFVHRNEPGVMSRVNDLARELRLNICGQQLRTSGDVGTLSMDVEVNFLDERFAALISGMQHIPAGIKLRVI